MNDFPRDDLIRMVELGAAELRAEGDGPGTLTGYAAVFNKDTLIDSWEGKFMERLAPGAFTKTLLERGDKVKVLFNHGFDPSIGDKPLGKPSRMEERGKGLYVEVPLDDTTYNKDLSASLRSGALDGMSFRFSVVREEWDDEDTDLPTRTIRELKLYELGPVTFPAYDATTAGVRAREAYTSWRQTHPAGVATGNDTSPRHLSPEQEAQVGAMRATLEHLRRQHGAIDSAVR
jgi:HK97 family phage prohead protease